MRFYGVNKLSTSRAGLSIVMLGYILSIITRWAYFSQELMGIHMWRQTQTQWNIRNFYRYSFDIFNPRTAMLNEDFDNVVLLEFPLMQWLIAGVHRALNNSDAIIITRISMLLISLFTVIALYDLLVLIFKKVSIAVWTCLFFMFSPLFYYYSICPLPDNFALCMGLWFLVFIIKYSDHSKLNNVIASSLFLGLATLAKLPFVIFCAPVIVVFIKTIKARKFERLFQIVLCFTLSLLPAFFWYMRAVESWDRQGALSGVFGEPVSAPYLAELFLFNTGIVFPVRVIGLGAVLFFVVGLVGVAKSGKTESDYNWFLVTGLVACSAYFLYELTIIEKVHDYYLIPFLPFVFITIGKGIEYIKELKIGNAILGVSFLFSLVYAIVIVSDDWSLHSSYGHSDMLTNREQLKAIVPGNNDCIFLNDNSGSIFSYHMDQWGYMFDQDYLPMHWIYDIIDRGNVRYMYSTSRVVDESIAFEPFIDTVLYHVSSVKVLKLKLPDTN